TIHTRIHHGCYMNITIPGRLSIDIHLHTSDHSLHTLFSSTLSPRAQPVRTRPREAWRFPKVKQRPLGMKRPKVLAAATATATVVALVGVGGYVFAQDNGLDDQTYSAGTYIIQVEG